MIPSDFYVHIEDATLAWQDVTEKLRSCTDGTTGESQVIPSVTLVFAADVDEDFTTLLNPKLNRDRARIRITDGDLVTWYLLEKQSGQVTKGNRHPTVSGRAYAGVLDNWRPVSHDWPMDMAASAIAAQVAHQDITNQSGATVGVIWQATLDPTIQGGRYSVSKKRRREIINDIAEACAACVRTSADGLSLEVYDRPGRVLNESAERNYTDALSLNYEMDRVDEPANAVRVQGEVIEYTRPTLPVVKVTVIPGSLDADGSASATGRAQVFDSTGRPVQHSALVDEAISAGSYTDIPVSGCYSVQGVWLNSGTAESPIKGAKITPTGFTASIITVPTQATQLFIVSYTQAEQVSWSSALITNEVIGEAQSTTGSLAVSTDQPIGSVRGVYRATDSNRTGTNFYTGGSATPNTTSITLGISAGAAGTAVVIDYDEYEASASVNISPSSSLCAADGWAETTVGAGTTVGMVNIMASGLGQEGRAPLSLLGSAIGSLQVTAAPATIRAQQPARVVDTLYPAEITEVEDYADAFKAVTVDNLISVGMVVNVGGVGQATVVRWENDTDTSTYKIIILTAGAAGTAATVTYYGREVIDEEDQQATITAKVLDAAADPVSDGTEVLFALIGRHNGAVLSANSAVTSGGEASVTLTAGGVAEFQVRVIAGSYYALAEISVVDTPIASDGEATTSGGYITSGTSEPWSWDADNDLDDDEYLRDDGRVCREVLKDWENAAGNIEGLRKALNCDGAPIIGATVFVDGAYSGITGQEGYFGFTVAEAGTHTASIGELIVTFSVEADGDTRLNVGSSDSLYYEACRDRKQ